MTNDTFEFLKMGAGGKPNGETSLVFGIKIVVFDTEQDCVSYIAKQAIAGKKVTFVKK